MSKRPARPPKGKWKEILDAAAEAFAEKGFAGARMDEVARKAGVNKATIYYHVGNKEALYLAVVAEYERKALDTISEGWGGVRSSERKLSALIGAVTKAMFMVRPLPQIILRGMVSAEVKAPVMDGTRYIVKTIKSVLEEGTRRGAFRSESSDIAHLFVIGGILLLALNDPQMRIKSKQRFATLVSDSSTERVAAAISDLILNGVKVQNGNQGSARGQKQITPLEVDLEIAPGRSGGAKESMR